VPRAIAVTTTLLHAGTGLDWYWHKATATNTGVVTGPAGLRTL
jgi:hypothetical protein